MVLINDDGKETCKGEFTQIYDEGMLVYIDNLVFFTFFKYVDGDSG